MALFKGIKEELEVTKDFPREKKIEYFWFYHKWHVIIGIFVLLIIISTVKSAITAKETVMYGIMFNCDEIADPSQDKFEPLRAELCARRGIDLRKKSVDFVLTLDYDPQEDYYSNENMSAIQVVAVQNAIYALDFAAGDLDTVMAFAYSFTFCDLTSILSPEQLEKYASNLLYIDMAVANRRQAGEEVALPDPTKPETMEDPVAVLLDMSDSEYLKNGYTSTDAPLALGVALNVPRLDNTLALIDILMEN